MPPLSVSDQIRKVGFIKRWLGDSDGTKVQKAMPMPPQQPQLGTGFVTELEDPRIMWINDKLKVETDRLATLTDIRIMLEQASYVDGPCDQFCRWATEGKINLNFNGGSEKRASRIVGDMLERINYNIMRPDLLYNFIFLELFIKQQVEFSDDFIGLMALKSEPDKIVSEFQRGMTMGQISEILTPAPETMFRNSNYQDKFDNPMRAFYQVPEVYNQQNTFAMTGQKQQFQEWFHHLMILHPRWNFRRQKSQRYSRPALKSARKHFNRAEMSSTDAVIQRHLTASRLLVIYLKKNVENGETPGATVEEVESYAKEFIRKYPRGFNKPGTVLIESGANEVESKGDLNITLSKPADIYMHLELLFLGFLFPTQLTGYSGGEGGRVTGPLLEQLKKCLEVNIGAINLSEDRNILLPLINMELGLHGIFDTEVTVTHSESSFDSKSVTRKTHLTEVEMSLRSRQDYYEQHVMPETGKPFDEHWKQCLKEAEELNEVNPKMTAFGDRKDQPEGVDKGQSGSKKDSETTPVSAKG